MEIPFKNGEVVLYYSDLIYAECDKPSCKLYFEGDKNIYSIEISLRQLLENLPCKPFFQCNRQNIINLCRYKSYNTKPPVIVMNNGKELSLSFRKIAGFRRQKSGLPRFSQTFEFIKDDSERLLFTRGDVTKEPDAEEHYVQQIK